MHPDDDSNRPAEIVQQYWAIYPQFLRDLFVQAFVDGLTNPAGRVTEGAVDQGDGPAARRHGHLRQLRHHQLLGRRRARPGLPPLLAEPAAAVRAPGSDAAPSRSARSPRCAPTTSSSGVDDPRTLGKVRQHPQDPSRWGISNASGSAWAVSYPDGQQHELPDGQTIELVDGAKIQLGRASATVRRPR